MKTIDKYQGRDKACVIVSLVRSNEGGEVGLLEDKRRVNVLLSRAKHKLILVGSIATLERGLFQVPCLNHLSSFIWHLCFDS